MPLSPGFHRVPPGMVAAVVTHLEMRRDTAPPPARPAPTGYRLEVQNRPDALAYRRLFAQIGAPWLWFSRLRMDIANLRDILHDPQVEVAFVTHGAGPCGLLELDFRTKGACELAFLGLMPGHTGLGLGAWLMSEAVARAWSAPIERFYVHTCTLDSPQALPFYLKSGFTPIRQEIEIAPDPRLSGALPKDSAPQHPIFGPAT